MTQKDKLTIGKTNVSFTANADTKHKLSLNIDAKFEVFFYFLTFYELNADRDGDDMY